MALSKNRSPGRHKKRSGAPPRGSTAPPTDERGDGFIWGRQPVLEALRGNLPLKAIRLSKGARGVPVKEIIRQAEEKGLPVEIVSRESLEKNAPAVNHQGVIAIVGPYRYWTVEELLQKARHKKKPPFLLMLDHIQDPQNLGSLLRTAHACGADGVIIPRDRACAITPAVYKSSAGALAYIPVARTVNLVRESEHLKKEGLWVMAAHPGGETSLMEADFTVPLVLVLGSEGRGLSRLLKEKCDFLLCIPMEGSVSSLNVSVAGGIIMYRIFSTRCAEGAASAGGAARAPEKPEQ